MENEQLYDFVAQRTARMLSETGKGSWQAHRATVAHGVAPSGDEGCRAWTHAARGHR